jgi:hypothetical protein
MSMSSGDGDPRWRLARALDIEDEAHLRHVVDARAGLLDGNDWPCVSRRAACRRRRSSDT